MAIKLNRDSDYYCLTCNGIEIDGGWAYFKEFHQAEDYLKSGLMTFYPNKTYGIVKVSKTLWDYIP